LQPVVNHYLAVAAREDNSFANPSLAAKGGWAAADVLDPGAASDECGPGETPLACEYRLTRPAVALIMLGTNDVRATPPEAYEQTMRAIVETTLRLAIIPVLSTIPDLQRDWAVGRVAPLNDTLRQLARDYDVPLVDYAAAMQLLPNSGLSFDGVHPSTPPDGLSAHFTPENLQYGYTLRNLLTLQVLDQLWRGLGMPPATPDPTGPNAGASPEPPSPSVE
jgi:hypothetical protein